MNALLGTVILLLAFAAPAFAGDSKPPPLTPVPIQQVVLQDDFWSPKMRVWREVTIPDCLAKFEKDGALSNFDKIRDGLGGDHGGPPWYDGLIYEMIRGCADFLAAQADTVLEARLDGYIEHIAAAAAKDPDGYVNTWTQLKAPTRRWGLNGGNDVEQHDVYNAGAMVEAAVHYYRATGKTRLLQVATKLANHMADVMGPPPKQNVVPGHSLGEEALVKLYLLFRERPELKSRMPLPVDEQRYLKLAEFWIENRGNHEGGRSFGRFDGAYAQDHKPVLQQETIEGHAVRATLLCAGLVATANVNGRDDYLTAARRLWENMVQRRMYVIGGLGAVAGHEGFGPDYVLPNNGYLETCAAIGAGFFHYNMNLAFADARYADELERVLYNAVLPGVSLQGNSYFYENPLEAGPRRSRWSWHGCPCCPPMFLKITGAMPGYIYAQDQAGIYVNLFVGSRAEVELHGGKVVLHQMTRYPWDGAIKLRVDPERGMAFALNLRLPSWCAEPTLQVNGQPLTIFEKARGYACLQRHWQGGDVVELLLPMPVQRLKANPKVEADIGRVALQRGPLVYCLEAVDNGGHVRNLVIPPEVQLAAQHRADLLGGVTVLHGPALALYRKAWPEQLYLPSDSLPGITNVEFTAIPYFANANRQPGEMIVWAAETASKAERPPSPAWRLAPSHPPPIAGKTIRSPRLTTRSSQAVPTTRTSPASLGGITKALRNGCNMTSTALPGFPPSRSIGGTNDVSRPIVAYHSPGGCYTYPVRTGSQSAAPPYTELKWTASIGSPLTRLKPKRCGSKSNCSRSGLGASWNGRLSRLRQRNSVQKLCIWLSCITLTQRLMKPHLHIALLLTALLALESASAQEARITVWADHVLHPVSRYLTGACIEDVNHEIYGGLYSQMVFGESFQEPAASVPPRGFRAFGGQWRVRGEELHFSGVAGDKLVSELPPFADGEVGVEVFVADRQCSNAGLIVRVDKPGAGADNLDGYEIALNAAEQNLRLGRHRHNWEPIQDTPCAVPTGQWVPLLVKLDKNVLQVFVNGKSVIRYEDGAAALLHGTVGLRAFQNQARFRNLWVNAGGQKQSLPFVASGSSDIEISRMWRPVVKGNVIGAWSIEEQRPFVGGQSQRLTLVRGQGKVGVENQGLNRWGLFFAGGKSYEGVLWARTEQPAELWVALESADGRIVHAEKRLRLKAGDWQRLEFSLTPKSTEAKGRMAVSLKEPGSVALGYAFLQPGKWGRFKGLPVRRDVAEGLINQGITVLRYGGSMVNHPEYRWKKMIGPRDRRPPYRGTWYPYSSNGWGILDFMDFCEAAGFEYVPAFYMGETPQDMADFFKYAKGPANSVWGRKRVADGHPAPYRLKQIELGNEERVDEDYWQKFKPMAEAIWAQEAEVILVVGDLFYSQVIRDPYNFDGGAVKTLAAHKKILDLAREHHREVWFDIHIGTEQPPAPSSLAGERSFIEQLGKLSPGAQYKVAIFEFNAGNHSHRRALANALAINLIERDGRIPIATSANCLQPDGENDNDWNQGLLFLNPSLVWLQPPGYVTQMFSRNYLPELVQCEVTATPGTLDVSAKRSDDGRTLVLQAVNPTDMAVPAQLHIAGFVPGKPTAQVTELVGPLGAENTAAQTNAVVPHARQWLHALKDGHARYTFPPYSVTVLRLE